MQKVLGYFGDRSRAFLECCSIKILHREQRVWLWMASTQCILVVVCLPFNILARFSSQKAQILKITPRFYYIGEPVSIDIHLSIGEVLLQKGLGQFFESSTSHFCIVYQMSARWTGCGCSGLFAGTSAHRHHSCSVNKSQWAVFWSSPAGPFGELTIFILFAVSMFSITHLALNRRRLNFSLQSTNT